MKIKEVSLETVCGITSRLPDNKLPEFAFVGKSNVGKSSLINALMNRKALARTSSQPGKTRTVNFYNINSELYFVDLPGYGYAKVAKTEQEKWGKMIDRYLKTSKQLRLVFLLIDIRHEPGALDQETCKWLCERGYQPIVIATKADKIKRSQKEKQLRQIRTALNLLTDTVIIPFSSVTKDGREEIYEEIDKVLEDIG
ncbi:MAG: YihA family ribosome biogenesis GTP-binding protein [Lachnospiraceae bacterium]|nr:YihA family ribosome biogenesis GTP-binding protein [Lachnospiraceae bacterium]